MYEHDADGRLSSSTATPEAEFGPTDLAWFTALRELEDETLPHGFTYAESTDPDADPNNNEGHFRFVAGTPVIDPETKKVVFAGTFDWAEKARLDRMADMRGLDRDPLAGIMLPVQKVPHTPRPRRVRGRHRRDDMTTPPTP